MSPPDRRLRPSDPRVRLAVVLLVGLVPWSVQRLPGELFVRFAWGGVSFQPAVTLTGLWRYPLGGGVPVLSRWAIATGCWIAAAFSAVAAFRDREDRRLTAGLVVLAGLGNLLVSLTVSSQPTRVGYPVGSVAAVVAAVWLVR